MQTIERAAEWLETDGRGGFVSGTVGGERTRRYHALVLAARTPPTGRFVLVNGLEAWITTAGAHVPLSTQRYAPDVVYPDNAPYLSAFERSPWPRWRFAGPCDFQIEQEIFVHRRTGATILRWTRISGTVPCKLSVRLLLSGRDYHSLHHENTDFRFDAQLSGETVSWHPYEDVSPVSALSNGEYRHLPEWYRNFLYTAERERGLDDTEDLASPGEFTFDLQAGAAVIVLQGQAGDTQRALACAERLASEESAARAAISPLRQAALHYRAVRGAGQTLVAGYPWFTDWGRDTFIAMRGLVLAAGELDVAAQILGAWAGSVSEGMLPNRFVDSGEMAEFNSVDASLWFIVAVHDFLAECDSRNHGVAPGLTSRLQAASEAILDGYSAGTRFGIAADSDGLLRAGVDGVQLTWMDAKTGNHVVTPRIGKPVEIQALWINALRIAGSRWNARFNEKAELATASFLQRFNAPGGGLLDVVDDGHAPGAVDASVRPNQILAVGGLPFPILSGDAARAVVDVVEAHLLTPLGLRTLSPQEPAYIGHYRGGPESRDSAYHQGTAWPWLMGPFVDAWLAVRGRTEQAKLEAGSRFLAPLMAHLNDAGLGHVSEIVDGDAPFLPGGCPFQAWSLGELMRIRRMLDLDV